METNNTKRTAKMFTETKILKSDLKVGDTMWFSGYWCTVTRFANGMLYGRFPYTPEGRDVAFSYLGCSAEWVAKYGPMMVTVRTANV